MKYILAHDLGTSGNKATLFAENGKMLGSEVFSYGTHYFNDTWVEQNAEDWWNAVCHTSKNLIKASGINPKDVAVISFSGQMMGCLCVDEAGNPLRPSIIWADQRAQEQVKQIEAHISQQDFYHIVGHRNTASYGIQKLMWVRDNEPDTYARTCKTLNAKDFVIFRLTGKFYTDYSDGNSCGCFDINKFEWSADLLKYANIDPGKMPEVVPSTHVAGEVTEEAAKACGLAVGTPVVLGGGDGVTANVGAGSISPGKTYCSMGTSAWITTTSEKPIFDKEMRTVTWAHAIPGLYAPNGTMQYAGGAYNWLKNTICTMEVYQAANNPENSVNPDSQIKSGKSPYEYMNDEASKSAPGSNGVIFLPYMLGERAPRWDPYAKGAYIGIKPETTRGDMIRSVLEGSTMNLAIVLEVLRTQVPITEIMALGGGAKGALWRQIMADIYNAKITVPIVLEEAGAMGAAVIGGVGVGLFDNFKAIDRFIEIKSEHLPDPKAVEAYGPIKKQFDDYYFALKGVFEKISK